MKKKPSKWEITKKVLTPRNIIVLIVLLVGNSFAWFIYATEVDNEMSARVRAWDVLFEAGDSPIVNYVDVDVDSMFPGMEDFIYTIKAYNRSEVEAKLSYVILNARILDEEYITKEGRGELGESPVLSDLTSAQLVTKLKTDYPFKINFSLTSTEMDADIGEAEYEITVKWLFESGNDAFDTLWGNKAAAFKKTHPEEPSIKMKIKITIMQKLAP